jgi:hypothetical protein
MPVLSTLGAAIANVYGFTSGLIKDQYFNLVSLLLPGNGTNGKKNNDFVDSSTANSGTGWSITPNGDVTQGTFSPFSQTGWGAYFDGTGDYLTVPDDAAFDYGSGDFTLECWIYPTITNNGVLLTAHTSGGNYGPCNLYFNAGALEFYSSSNNSSFDVANGVSGGTPTVNSWNHVAVSRSGTSIRCFLNGSVTSTTTSSATLMNATGTFQIGARNGSSTYTGYISNFRVVKGTAVYTGAFTPPTSPLTAISGTSLLTCQSNRFRDASSNGFTVTSNGNTSVTPFSPFAPTSSYSAAAVGGSGYFDGSGDYLSAASNAAFGFGTGDFTVEAWVYITGGRGERVLFVANATNGANIFLSGSGLIGIGRRGVDVNNTFGSTPTSNSWNHVAVARSGTSITCWVNGAVSGTQSQSNSINYAQGAANIGAISDYADQEFGGYISSLRVVKGTAVYNPASSTITVPTAPLTNITNTSLLLNFTNAGVVDATAKNVLETEGNAQISTAQSKWGGGSISVSSGNYLTAPSNVLLPFGTGDFTIEFWAYWNGGAFSTYATAIDTRNGSFAGGLAIAANITTGAWYVSISAQEILGTVAAAASWQHIAVTRSGTSLRLFVNGTQTGSTYTSSDNFSNTTLRVGVRPDNQYPWNGYLDDIRITRGLARYTANFTPPTAPFPLQ